ncbi:MAG: transglutaminase domain-containing protein [Rhodanobacteraceae bacterium]|nr:transglutaminase domain-containing protein [Rhodanobacteraceae bacterium]
MNRDACSASRCLQRACCSALRLALSLLAAIAPPAAARHYTAAIEHEGVRYGSVTFERVESAGVVHTHEKAAIGVRALKKREWRRYEQHSSARADGSPLTLSRRTVSGAASLQASARFVGGRIELERREGGQTRRDTLPAPADLLVDASLQQRIAVQPRDVPWSFTYSEVDLATAQLVSIHLSSSGVAVGDRLELLRETGQGDARSRRRLYWSLTQQRLLPSWEFAGARFDSHACNEPCTAEEAQYFDLFAGLMVASPYHIPVARRRKTLRYVFESADGLTPEIPATGEQAVARRGRRSVVTICQDCGDEAAPDPAALARFRTANAWVQSDHPSLRALAHSVRANGSIEARMYKLVRFVQQHMDGMRQSLGYASALQAAQTRSGDCTEFALLLAALARAQQIPARVVGGLLYSSRYTGRQDVFSPHAWVQVWNGARWVSFDAGVGDFDSTHVVLAIGDGSAADYADLLRQVRSLRIVAAAQIAAP